MLILLPFFCLILISQLLYEKRKSIYCARAVFLVATLFLSILIVFITELLSIFNAITFISILSFWLITTAALIVLVFVPQPRKNNIFIPIHKIKAIPLFEKILIFCIITIIIIIGIIALTAPPNTWDSMTYHMPRVSHWIQDRTLSFYPTNIQRQLYQPPLAEILIMHIEILGRSDRYVNLIQWFAMIISIIGVSLIAKELGAKRRGQIYSSIFAVTLPMGILQGSSTQNDYVLSLWIIICAWTTLCIIQGDKRKDMVFYFAFSVGLSILTKGTGYIYVVPFILWVFLWWIKRLKFKAISQIVIVSIIILCINWGHYYRNYQLYNSPIYTAEEHYKNEVFGLRILLSNIIKNLSIHIGCWNDAINNKITDQIKRFHYMMGIDVNDPRTTWSKFKITKLSTHEDYAGNPIHFFLIVLILIIIPFYKIHNNLRRYTITVISAFILFCALLKWQEWNSRLQLPIFLLYAPIVGTVFSERVLNCYMPAIINILLLFASIPWIIHNQSRPLLGVKNIFNVSRQQQYFFNRKYMFSQYKDAVDYIKTENFSRIGLLLNKDGWEYPFWVMLKQPFQKNMRIEHINITNPSGNLQYPLGQFSPEIILSLNADNKLYMQIGEDTYVKTRKFTYINIFVKDAAGKLKKQNLIYHFFRAFEYLSRAEKLLAIPTISTYKAGITTAVSMLTNTYEEAMLVDSEMLNQIYPKLGDKFRGIFVQGIRDWLMGYSQLNKQRFQTGQKLIREWRQWFSSNMNTIKEAFNIWEMKYNK